MGDNIERLCEPVVSCTSANTITTGDQKDGSDSDSVKMMADKHATIRQHLNQAELELVSKSEAVKALEEKIRIGCSQISIAEQKLQSLNETINRNNESLQDHERLYGELITESVDLDEYILNLSQKLESVTAKESADKIIMEEYKQKVTEAERRATARARQEEILYQLEEEYKQLSELEERTKHDDPDLKRITSGQALQIVDAQKMAIMDAFGEQEMNLEQLRNQLGEKQQEVASLEQSIKVEQKQNQARLLRMQKQLTELEDTERHLKKTALHLESQRDYGME